MRYSLILLNTFIWTPLFGLTGIFLSLFERDKGKALGICARLWAKSILTFTGIKYSVKGTHFIEDNKNYLFAGNHTSALDILLAFAGLHYWLVPISKIELKSVFLLGWVMDTAGHIWVDRKKSDRAIKAMEDAKNSLMKLPRSVLIFPEGTRTIDGKLGLFKQGGLLLSIDTKIPIVPIAFVGTFDMLKKGTYRIKGSYIELRIGKPISPEKYSYQTRKELANEVRDSVINLISNKK